MSGTLMQTMDVAVLAKEIIYTILKVQSNKQLFFSSLKRSD